MTDLGIDATHWIAGKDIKATGYDFVGRYCLSGAYRITPDEVADYHANGLGIEFFGEHEADFMLRGGPRGTDSGNDAREFLTSLGAPIGIVVFFTVDFDVQPNQIPALGAFMSAASIAITPYRAGIYGGLILGESFGNAWPYHQTEAWSHGEISPYANFYQRVGTTLPPIPNAGSYDEDIAINPIGLWLPPGSPTEDDEMIIGISSDGRAWAIQGGVVIHQFGGVPTPTGFGNNVPAEAVHYLQSGITNIPLTDNDLNSLALRSAAATK